MWKPIAEARRDGTPYLLWYPASTLPDDLRKSADAGLAIDGWYFSSPKGMDDGWETVIGSIGEPSHFAKIQVPT